LTLISRKIVKNSSNPELPMTKSTLSSINPNERTFRNTPYMSDRIVLMTNGPAAKIGEILEVSFSHPRDRAQMRNSKEYYELRNYALNFLDKYFTQDE
jgi:hypothetical protein